MSNRAPGEGTITRRKDGRWQASLQVDGRRRTVYGRTRAEASSKLDELKQQAATAGAVPSPGRRTLNDLLDVWLDTKGPALKPRTLSDYRLACERYLRPTLGPLRLGRVTPDRVQRLLTRYQKRGQHRTALRIYRTLSQALDLAVRWSWLASNPCKRVDTPRYRPERKEVWTVKEVRVFLGETENHWLHPLWFLAVYTGCRLGELLALTWEDVDFPSAAVRVSKSVQRIAGRRVVTTPKTRAGVRRIALPAEVFGVLAEHRSIQAKRRLRMGQTWQGEELVFTSRAGRPLAHSTVEWCTSRECQRLRLPPMTPHGLRHLSASLLLAEGLSLPAVSQRLGHANSAITMSTYAHALHGDDQAAAQAIARAIGNGE